MKKKLMLMFTVLLLVLTAVMQVSAQESDIPDRMRVGVVGKCGDMFEFRLAAVPSLTNGIADRYAKADLNFLVLRVAIKNLTSQTVNLKKDSFKIREVYNSIYYGEYYLDKAFTYYSAYIGNEQLTYDDPIGPGEERPTTLIFQVYPNIEQVRYPLVTGWVLSFTPSDPSLKGTCTLEFLLPEAERY